MHYTIALTPLHDSHCVLQDLRHPNPKTTTHNKGIKNLRIGAYFSHYLVLMAVAAFWVMFYSLWFSPSNALKEMSLNT